MLVQVQDTIFEKEELKSLPTAKLNQQIIISGFRQKLVHLSLKFTLFRIAMRCYNNPFDWIGGMRYLIKLRRQFLGDNKLQKMAFSGKKYYMGLYMPGWNSQIYSKFIASQLNDFKPIKNVDINRFNTIFIAITKKCALQCEHCYEWENLNKKDVLSVEELSAIVRKIQDQGVSQIQFSGGEPLLKMNTLVNVIKGANKSTEFWVVTSGFKLDYENAKQLKEVGLTGVIISLDHYIPEIHNEFRHFKDAYFWVEEAIKNAKNHDLLVALSLCATKDFISENNLMFYMELAKNLNVSFVQFLEPKAVGHYANKDVLLHQSHIKILEELFIKMNFNPDYNSFPIITYHGFHQRRQGCFSAGIKGLYVDTDGDINACPFCHKKTGNILDENFEENLAILKSEGCHSY